MIPSAETRKKTTNNRPQRIGDRRKVKVPGRLTWRDGFFPPGLLTFTLDMHGRPSELRIDAPNRDFDFTELEFQRA